jgi:NAD(P)-dependent dehydrogenase (short-subunit alcohol dehydrogenase family)
VTAAHDALSVLDRLELGGKVAVVTRASQPIGFRIGLALARCGAQVVLGAATADQVTEVVRDLRAQGARVNSIAPDTADDHPARAMLVKAIESLGCVDVVVHAPGGYTFNAPYSRWRNEGSSPADALADVAHMCESVGPHMAARRRGSIVIVVPPATVRPWPDITATAMKLALLELTRTLAQEWAHLGVRINAVSCRTIGEDDRPSTDGRRGDVASEPPARQSVLDGVTAAVLWLASGAASNVTGLHIPADRGLTITIAEGSQRLLGTLRPAADEPYPETTHRVASIDGHATVNRRSQGCETRRDRRARDRTPDQEVEEVPTIGYAIEALLVPDGVSRC